MLWMAEEAAATLVVTSQPVLAASLQLARVENPRRYSLPKLHHRTALLPTVQSHPSIPVSLPAVAKKPQPRILHCSARLALGPRQCTPVVPVRAHDADGGIDNVRPLDKVAVEDTILNQTRRATIYNPLHIWSHM